MNAFTPSNANGACSPKTVINIPISPHKLGPARVLKWTTTIICALLGLYFVFEVIKPGPTVIRINQTCEAGCNGMVFRLLCSDDPRESIAWDDVGTTLRIRTQFGVTFVQVPFWLPFLAFAFLGLIFSWVDRQNAKHFAELRGT